jgi:hypothetical protein
VRVNVVQRKRAKYIAKLLAKVLPDFFDSPVSGTAVRTFKISILYKDNGSVHAPAQVLVRANG